MTEPADPYRRPDPTAWPLPPAPVPPPPPAERETGEPQTPDREPETNVWTRPDGQISGPPMSGPPGYPTTLPVPYPPAPAAYPSALPYEPYQTYQTYPNQPYPPQHFVVVGTTGYGVDPITGQPLSAKSKVVAGLLQLLLGFLFGLGGVGRLYAGNTTIGVVQLAATLVGWISFWCGFVLFFPFLVYAAIWVWFVVDGIVMLAGRPVDGQGLPLRP